MLPKPAKLKVTQNIEHYRGADTSKKDIERVFNIIART